MVPSLSNWKWSKKPGCTSSWQCFSKCVSSRELLRWQQLFQPELRNSGKPAACLVAQFSPLTGTVVEGGKGGAGMWWGRGRIRTIAALIGIESEPRRGEFCGWSSAHIPDAKFSWLMCPSESQQEEKEGCYSEFAPESVCWYPSPTRMWVIVKKAASRRLWTTVGDLHWLFYSSHPAPPMSVGKHVCFLRLWEMKNVSEYMRTKQVFVPLRGEIAKLELGVKTHSWGVD